MSHSSVKFYVHAILGVKYKEAVIQPAIKEKVYELLAKELENLSCSVVAMNGMPDHIHVLFLMHPDVHISKVMQQMKGASSRRINQAEWLDFKFAWQVGYGAFSVSQSGVPKVKQYIKNQEQHHKIFGYEEEFKMFEELHELG